MKLFFFKSSEFTPLVGVLKKEKNYSVEKKTKNKS